MRKALAFLLIAAVLITSAFSADAGIPIKVLLLPKFENGEMSGDFPGEAQYYYEAYTQGGDEYEIKGGMPGSKLYVKDGVAIYVTGMGKVNTAMSLNSILLDPRFEIMILVIMQIRERWRILRILHGSMMEDTTARHTNSLIRI